tara:strand:+ start:2839 stop:3693 length:855 start_codon:yes stop_codon:yes gene_type:complete
MDVSSVVIDRAWWDFDITEDTTFDDVKRDVHSLVSKLQGDVRLVATGRGFHVHQFLKKPLHGTGMSNHLDRYQRVMANGSKTLDGVANPAKLTRIPDTYNPKRKRWAVNVDVSLFMKDPMSYKIPKQPCPKLKKLDPFIGSEPNGTFDLIKWVSDNPPKVEQVTRSYDGDIGASSSVPLPPCLEQKIREENPRHFTRLFLATHLAENLRWFADPSTLTHEQLRDIEEQIISFISPLKWRDYNENISRKHIKSVVRYGNSISCSKIQANGLCVGSCWRDDGTRRN